MLARMLLSSLTIALVSSSLATAADLGAGGSIGEIFVPGPIVKVPRYAARDSDFVVAPWVNNSPRVPGYYGRAGDFYYSSYYGTSPLVIWRRLPYACKFYASC